MLRGASKSSFTKTERKHLQDIFVIPRQPRRVFIKYFFTLWWTDETDGRHLILRTKVGHTRGNEHQMFAFSCSTTQKPCRNTIPESDYLRHCTSMVLKEVNCIFVGLNLQEFLPRSAMSNEAIAFSFHLCPLCPPLRIHRHIFYFHLHICFNNKANVIKKIKISCVSTKNRTTISLSSNTKTSHYTD